MMNLKKFLLVLCTSAIIIQPVIAITSYKAIFDGKITGWIPLNDSNNEQILEQSLANSLKFIIEEMQLSNDSDDEEALREFYDGKKRSKIIRSLYLNGDNCADIENTLYDNRYKFSGISNSLHISIPYVNKIENSDQCSINIMNKISTLNKLVELRLENIAIGDEGAKIINNASNSLGNLNTLEIINGGITNNGVRSLISERDRLTVLSTLDLSNNLIDDNVAEIITRNNYLNSINYLTLRDNEIENRDYVKEYIIRKDDTINHVYI